MKYLISIFVLLLSTVAFSSPSIVRMKGADFVWARYQKKKIKVKMGDSVKPGTFLIVPQLVAIGLKYENDFIVHSKGKSQFVVQKRKGSESISSVLNLVSGKLRALTTDSNKKEKRSFYIKTKSAVTGVRGTDFIVEYDERSEETEVTVFEGEVEMGPSFASLEKGEGLKIRRGQKAIRERSGKPPKVEPFDMKALEKSYENSNPDFKSMMKIYRSSSNKAPAEGNRKKFESKAEGQSKKNQPNNLTKEQSKNKKQGPRKRPMPPMPPPPMGP